MTSGECREFERRDGFGRGGRRETAWREHLWSCPSCREQDAADRALRALFAGARPPEPSPSFARRCASRARRIPPASPLGVRPRLVLRLYWALAAAVTAAVMLRTDWPALLSSSLAPAAAVALATVVVPVLLLARLRGGVLTLLRHMLA